MSEFNAFCRTCMHQFENNSSEAITESYNIFKTKNLAKNLIQCSQLVVAPTDGYPQLICKKCYETIMTFTEFQRMCRDSAEVFREILSIGKQGSGEVARSLQKLKGSIKVHQLSDETKLSECNHSHDEGKYVLDDTHNDNHIIDFTLNETVLEDRFEKEDHSLFETESVQTNRLKNIRDFNREEQILKNTQALNDCETTKQMDHIKKNINQDLNQKTDISRQIYKCDVKGCGLEFATKQEINLHLREQHYSGRNMSSCKYICEFCGTNIKSDEKGRKHEHSHHDKNRSTFKCDVNGCSKSYRSIDQYRKHKIHHHSTIPPNAFTYSIEVEASKTLPASRPISKLREHSILTKDISVKQQTRSYPCHFCIEEFSSNTLRNHHEMVHTGEKPFICEVCGRGFTQSSALKSHKRTHTIEGTIKNLTCPLCKRSFNTCTDLKQHVLKHAGEKPHECNVCAVKFRYKSNLRRHQRENLCNRTNEQSSLCGNNIAIVIET